MAGCDEAGRGAVIGPLVVGVVSIGKGNIGRLSKIGVRDSKLLTSRKREFLYDEIYSLAEEVKSYAILPEEINSFMRSGISINELEAIHFSKLINSLNRVDAVFVDSPDVIPERFGIRISLLSGRNMRVSGQKKDPKKKNALKVISEHKADSRYPIVSAASIIAKVTRDWEMEGICEKLSLDLGSGYPSDKKTVQAIKRNLKKQELSPYIRAYWKTMTGIRQQRIMEFINSSM